MRRMRRQITAATFASVLLTLALSTRAGALPKKVWNYDGGVVFDTDGVIPNGPCLRLSGRLTGNFFDGLKRIDDPGGTEFLRGPARVTHFPEQVVLRFLIRDHPCSMNLTTAGTSPRLTREIMRPLRLSFYWKRGLKLRPLERVTENSFRVERAEPYAKELERDLPERLIWSYEFAVPSAGVPLTDHLVIVLRAQDGRIVARVAARL